MRDLNLGKAQTPDAVARILHDAADQYEADALELSAAHQDDRPAYWWGIVASELHKCAGQIRKRLKASGFPR